jgi:hypothetical protein
VIHADSGRHHTHHKGPARTKDSPVNRTSASVARRMSGW